MVLECRPRPGCRLKS
ncbi:hypothetical protein MTR67_022411 [Solanum verrucosum]|uniref:Uncharacterized protein n=1 Tax=Solanum verrucosum TaxID=315347 RepID=A0AAF0QTC9_SOLVR|nr:hypothetical protein MTR67_022411 [Solanum verrucosum]